MKISDVSQDTYLLITILAMNVSPKVVERAVVVENAVVLRRIAGGKYDMPVELFVYMILNSEMLLSLFRLPVSE